MKALVYKEIKSFFGSMMGYLVVAVFLLLNGLFLWVMDGSYNILKSGYNDLTPFFKLAPWVLLLLVPAVTMKSFSEERKQGTLELLFTKPLSIWQIVFGKFLGTFVLILLALIPTLIYVFLLNPYGNPPGNLDFGSIIGAYLGLFFLIASYTAIGVFASTLSENQIVAFLLAIIFCFLLFVGFDELTALLKLTHNSVEKWGMNYHFESISRGVLDTRDFIYFLSLTLVFMAATVYQLKTLRQ